MVPGVRVQDLNVWKGKQRRAALPTEHPHTPTASKTLHLPEPEPSYSHSESVRRLNVPIPNGRLPRRDTCSSLWLEL